MRYHRPRFPKVHLGPLHHTSRTTPEASINEKSSTRGRIWAQISALVGSLPCALLGIHIRFEGFPAKGTDLSISPTGGAAFDYKENNVHVRPRRVVEMQCHSQQRGDMHEFIILKLSDPAHHQDLWVRFKPYSDPYLGNIAYKEKAFLTQGMVVRATLVFANGIEYDDVAALRVKMSKMFQTPDTKHNHLARACIFSEMLSLCIGLGKGLCSPQDLCEIWASQSDSDRRLLGLQWFEQDDSGVEYLVLHVVGTSDFTSMEDWWVRLERDGPSDKACISRDRDSVVCPGSTQTRLMTFQDGLPFEKVIEALRSVPKGLSAATEDCWVYASTVAHHLSVAVGDDICECPAEDLCEIWSSEHGSHLSVNRVQWLEEGGVNHSEYLIIKLSSPKDSSNCLWVRMDQAPISENDLNSAYVSGNRRRILRPSSRLLADVVFDELKFGEFSHIIKQSLGTEVSANCILLPGAVIGRILADQTLLCYWVKGMRDQLVKQQVHYPIVFND